MKKILITSNLYKPNIGGIENSLYFMSKTYIKAGFEVHLVASDINGFDSSVLPLYEKTEGINIYRYRGARLFPRVFNGIKLYRRLIKHNTYNKVISRSHLPVLMLRLSGVKNIIYILAGVSYKQNAVNAKFYSYKYIKRLIPNYFHHYMQYLAIRVSDENYVFSKNMVKQVSKYLKYNGNITVTKPGVDGNRFYEASTVEYNKLRCAFNYDSNDVVLIGVGRFYEVKGFDYLIKSMALLPNNFKLLLVGDGADRDSYNSIISELNLSSRISIVGPVSDTSSFYKLSDIYVLSSIHETLGQTVLEALFSGLPIVAFDDRLDEVLTATSEITDSSNSVFVKSFSEESLALTIIETARLLKENYFCKKIISSDARSTYSWEKIIEKI